MYYSGSEFSTKTNGCADVTLSPGVYYLDFPAGDDVWSLDTNVTGTCDATGQGTQLVFADSAHVMLSGTLTIPCGRKATADGPLIGIFGLKAGVAATGPFTTTLRPSATPTETQGTFWNAPSLANVLPGAAPTYPQDGTNAIASVTGNKSTSELTIGSFAATSGPAAPDQGHRQLGRRQRSRTTRPPASGSRARPPSSGGPAPCRSPRPIRRPRLRIRHRTWLRS